MIKKIKNKIIYDHIEEIASGGMGTVLKARENGIEGFEKQVAIKMLLPVFSRDRRFIEMFIKEAKLIANLVHENIVQIYQLNRSGRDYYFVMEYVNGVSLFQMILFHNRLKLKFPVKLAVFIASRVARGLAYAHSRRDPATGEPMHIVHCDICPHNVLINTEGVPKITDFGIARARSAQFDVNEETTVFAGKALFMSPEQALEKEDIDFRSDIYSLGMMMMFNICGTPGRSPDGTFEDIRERAKRNDLLWDSLPDDVDEDLRKIMRKMLATDPEDRYDNTAELARDLEFYIYKDGYGPTVVTLSNYMHKEIPGMLKNEFDAPPPEEKRFDELTVIMDNENTHLRTTIVRK